MKFDKRTYMFLGVGLGLILLFYILSMVLPGEEKVDWKENFESGRKNPYGTYLLKKSLPDLFDIDSLIVKKDPFFDLFALQNDTGISYIMINNQIPGNELDIDELFYFIEKGNHVFMSARKFNFRISAKLNFAQFAYETETFDSVSFNFTSQQEKSLKFPVFGMSYLLPGAEREYEVLAEDEYTNAVLIRYYLGKGSLILSSTPRIFSNYYMVQDEKRDFISQAFTQLPRESIIWWDEFYKREHLRFGNRGDGGADDSSGTMDYILSEEGLRWAFWLSILALIVYAIFESKRKQRIIPVIEPLPNLTLDFTETVGRLYFRASAHKEIAEKRIRALLAHIRDAYFLKTDKFDDKFLKSLSAKSNIPEPDIRMMFRSIDRVRTSSEITESQLIEINHYIDVFYKLGAR